MNKLENIKTQLKLKSKHYQRSKRQTIMRMLKKKYNQVLIMLFQIFKVSKTQFLKLKKITQWV